MKGPAKRAFLDRRKQVFYNFFKVRIYEPNTPSENL